MGTGDGLKRGDDGYGAGRVGRANPGVDAYLFVRLDGAACPRVAPLVRELPEVLSIESLAGELDMLIRVRVPDMMALNTLRERVAHLPEVRTVTTAPVLAVHLDRR